MRATLSSLPPALALSVNRSFFGSKFEELQTTLFASNPSVFPAAVFTFEDFLWAVCTVRARLHAPLEGEQAALVPFADLVSSPASGLFDNLNVLI